MSNPFKHPGAVEVLKEQIGKHAALVLSFFFQCLYCVQTPSFLKVLGDRQDVNLGIQIVIGKQELDGVSLH